MADDIKKGLEDIKSGIGATNQALGLLIETFDNFAKAFNTQSKSAREGADGLYHSYRRVYDATEKFYKNLFNSERDFNNFVKANNKERAEQLKNIGIKRGSASVASGIKSFSKEIRKQRDVNENIEALTNLQEIGAESFSESQKMIVESALKEQERRLDEIKKLKPGTTTLLRELYQAEKQQNQVNALLEGIRKGKIKATKAEAEDLLNQQKKAEKGGYTPGAFSSGFKTNLIQGTIGRSFGSTADWMTKDRTDFLKDQSSILKENIDAQNSYRSQISELEKAKDKAKTKKEKNAIQTQINELNEASAASNKVSRAIMGKNTLDYFKKGIDSFLKDVGKLAAETIIKIGKNAIAMLDEASTYAVSSSYKINSGARNQMLTYGLSESQNYAFSKTQSLMGISGDEDLFWMNSNQRSMFQDLMKKEMVIYDKMTQSGTLESFQKMQIDFEVMKQEFTAEIVGFIVKNKDTILNAAKLGVGFLKTLANGVVGILKFLNWAFGSNEGLSYDSLSSGANKGTGVLSAAEAEAYRHSSTDTLSTQINNNGGNKTWNVKIENNASLNTTDTNSGASQLADTLSERSLVTLSNFFNN